MLLFNYILIAENKGASMLIKCYDYQGDDSAVSEQLFRFSEWISSYAVGTRFYIREDRDSWVALLGPQVRRYPASDYVL